MSDIVGRLRERARYDGWSTEDVLSGEAADEITSLRAENERLLRLVKRIVEHHEHDESEVSGWTQWEALVKDARAALEGVTEPVSPWRDIESAPRDGTDFLALIPYNQKHHQMVGCFASKGKFRSWPGRHEYHPTHWMPLPEPPR